MEFLDHAHISGLLEPVIRDVALVTIMIVIMHHFHQLKLEKTISVVRTIESKLFGKEKVVQLIIHAAHSIILHTSAYGSLSQPPTALRYEYVMISLKEMRVC